jgi:hypothetical protein
MTESKAIQGHGCGGCYNCRKLEHNYLHPHYCKSYEVEGNPSNLSGILMVELLYRIIDTDLSERPDWCPLLGA